MEQLSSMGVIYQMELQFGLIDVSTVASYVEAGYIDANEYEIITGDKYETSTTQSEKQQMER